MLADRIATDQERKGPEAVALFFNKYYANCEPNFEQAAAGWGAGRTCCECHGRQQLPPLPQRRAVQSAGAVDVGVPL